MNFKSLALAICCIFASINSVCKVPQKVELNDAIKGSLVLGAYGDAQARITEFWTNYKTLLSKRPDLYFGNIHPMIPSLKSLTTNKPYARFTDDTHMSIYLAQALLQTHNQSIDTILNSMTSNFINWLYADQTERAPGIAATNNAHKLELFQQQGLARINLWSRGLLPSLDINQANNGLRTILFNKEGGSGAVMRVSPVSLIYYNYPKLAEQLSVVQGILTHTDSGSRAACAGLNAALCAILRQDYTNIEQIFDIAITIANHYDNRPYIESYNPKLYPYGQSHFSKNGCTAMCQKAKEYFKAGLDIKPYQEVLDEFRGWGATEALAATLYIFATWNHDPYIAMSIAINRTPGDSDTIAKMVGDMLGAQYGYQALKDNFAQHNLDLDQELHYLENINNLPEYCKDFTYFQDHNIQTFNDLAKTIVAIH